MSVKLILRSSDLNTSLWIC